MEHIPIRATPGYVNEFLRGQWIMVWKIEWVAARTSDGLESI